MRFLCTRRISVFLSGFLWLSSLPGCPSPVVPSVSPQVPGDPLSLMSKAKDKLSGLVKVRLEKLDAGKKKPDIYNLQFEEEHVVESIDAGGGMHVSGKFFNVESQGETAKERKAGDKLARALSDMQISFDISSRGEVSTLDVRNVSDALLPDARLIAIWVYGAERGALFDAGPVVLGKGWKSRAQIPIPSGGSKKWDINCSYAKRSGAVATVLFTGTVTGQSGGVQLAGELKGEVRLDTERGILTYSEVDAQAVYKIPDGGSQQNHITVTWQKQDRQAPPSSAPAPASAPASGEPIQGVTVLN